MSLVLDSSTHDPVMVKSWSDDDISFGRESCSLADFMQAVEYVMKNTNLLPNDPRVRFMDRVRRAEIGPGHSGKGRRIVFPMDS